MCHIGKAPGELSDLLDMLRPGDILTHTYSSSGNNTVQNGKVLPAALAAKKRGVIMDVGHGKGSFDYTIAETAIAQGLLPDTISSDLHLVSSQSPGKPYLPWVMSKFLHLGFGLEEVIAMTTINPARIIGRVPDLGTLKVGAAADVTILESVEQTCTFWDTKNNSRTGKRFLRPVVVIRDGRIAAQSSGTTMPYP
jgi:dihydroorotase